jgi:hypothetical protein
MTRKPLKGPFPLMPFVLNNSGALDLIGLKHNIRRYEQAGVPGYIVRSTQECCVAPA